MYQVETDSEDDYECLFLKPVDGYNISDRIRQANEELFASPGPESPSVIPRKVTFRRVLEEFDDGGDNISIVSVDSTGGETNSQNQNSSKKNLKHIPEEEEDDDEKHGTITESETEEIFEEIIELKLDEPEVIPQKTLSPTSSTVTDNSLSTSDDSQINRKSNRPKSPPLPTLQEERDSSIKFKEILLNSPHSSFDKTTVSPSSSEDDLSVIVASYIPEGLEIIEEKSTDDTTSTANDTKKIKKPKFSFRKKKKENLSSTTTSSSSSPLLKQTKNKKQQQNSKNSKSKIVEDKNDDDDSNDLKFHYKPCCEYRNAIDTNTTLPKYSGYLSEYGLSKKQLEKRQTNLEKQKKKVLEKNLKASEYEINKMDDNERAFTRWLKNKMRFPVNKTKNMFDFRQTKNVKKAKS